MAEYSNLLVSNQFSICLLIQLLVLEVFVYLIVDLFNQRNSSDDHDGEEVGDQEAHLKEADKLSHRNSQEVEVLEVPVLVEEEEGQKGYQGVLSIVNFVGNEILGPDFARVGDESLSGRDVLEVGLDGSGKKA